MDNAYQESEVLFELAAILGQQNDFEEILRLISSKACTLIDAELASIMMINPRTQNTVKTIVKEGSPSKSKYYQLVQTNVIGWVATTKKSFLSPDIKKDSRFRKGLFKDEAVHSVICVPLHSEGLTVGYLLALNKIAKHSFSENDLQLFEKMAAITAPFLNNAQRIQEYFTAPLPEIALVSKYESAGLLGKSSQFIELLRAVEAATRCDVRVLLEGQSGTGKELIARAIHNFSARKQHPFVAVDCGAIPENLIESELFGHVKGAFTGASQNRVGLIEEANHGTVFMDEIANLPLDMQSKMLRFLQENEIRPIGSNRSRKVDVRIVTASSSSLRKLVGQGKFREDLFYRLHVYPIEVPTLNARQEDISLLADHFVAKVAHQQRKQTKSLEASLANFMQQRLWAGNIRELENFVERLVTLASPDIKVLTRKSLPKEFQKEFKKLSANDEVSSHLNTSLQESLNEYEEKLIRQALHENDWIQAKAARALNISEQTLRYKMNRLGIVKPT
ncbi:GAF domain-containing protein [Candidatus Saccharibacteria bacterium]|nr:sigma-54-dependent Fis family transcriptional regulator [Candidatus Saccharibacteria bacterium]NIV04153.1 GAF domain-containing protein [Calditrichia bacterium]NIV72586.1 GAF domain-containing protein [Calditrichia bacterium]NIV99715.1 GAF domain-containing protein [Candidatus Saccharibacteria bacterium]NIW80821.1 GAF domain-containing protein [Calditrichia bacterium]